MRKSRLSITETNRRLKQAEGVLDQYQPFVRVHDFGSLGESARVPGKTTGREHHLLSRIEQSAFLVFDYSEKVCDIREQFPLVPLAKTLQLAKALKVKHPTDPYSKFPVIMTTDFLLTVEKDRSFGSLAVSIKSNEDYEKPRTKEKLQIERAFWEDRKVEWVLVLEDGINRQLIENLKLLDKLPPADPFIRFQMDILEEMILKYPAQKLEDIFLRYESEQDQSPGRGYLVFKHLLAEKRLKVDLTKKINLKEAFHEDRRDLPFFQ